MPVKTLVAIHRRSVKKLNTHEGINCQNDEPILGLGKSIVNLSNETLNELEITVLGKGLTFVPTPEEVNLDSLKYSVSEFKRKVKLSYFWADRELNSKLDLDYQKLPFTGKSDWDPPDGGIPEKVHTVLKELDQKIEDVRLIKDKNNLCPGQINALKQLKNKKHIIIKKADKGSAIVVMNKTDYIYEADRQLNDVRYYKKINEPIFPKTAEKYKEIIQSLGQNKILQPKQINYLMPNDNARERHFYLLPKIHKDVNKWTLKNRMPPGRPIVSDCSSESYNISEYLDFHLQPVANKHPSYIKDTYDFLDKIRNVKVPQDALLITLDIESLYTNIKTEDGMESVRKMFQKYPTPNILRPEKEILELLELNLNNNDFKFNDQWYLQVSGTAMGKKYAPSYANIDMAILEEEVLERASKKPLVFYRFLDDIFIIWTHSKEEFMEFFNCLNNHRESIKFQHNISVESVDFLDITIYKGNKFKHENTLDTKVYFKPTDTHELLHKSSFHPKHTFHGIIKSQLIRYFKICSDNETFDTACSILFHALRNKRNYSRRFLRKIKRDTVDMLEKCRSLYSPVGCAVPCGKRRCHCCLYLKSASDFDSRYSESEFTITGKLDCNSSNIVYLIECKKCEEQYVGETSKPLKVRLSNHVSDINRYKGTSIAEHFNQFDHNGVEDLQITPILQIPDSDSKIRDMLTRRKHESFFIKKLKTMSPLGINDKLEENGTLAFPVFYSTTASVAAKHVRETYDLLQEAYPKHFKNKLVTAFKRNKNLTDMLVSSKL